MEDFVSALKSVDLPTLGSPTRPACILMVSSFWKMGLYFRFLCISIVCLKKKVCSIGSFDAGKECCIKKIFMIIMNNL